MLVDLRISCVWSGLEVIMGRDGNGEPEKSDTLTHVDSQKSLILIIFLIYH